MSGDDESMEEILGKIRKIAAEDEEKQSKNPEPDKEMSPSEILHEIHSIIDEDAGTDKARREGHPGDRDIRFRRRALFVVLTGGLAGIVLTPFGFEAAGLPVSSGGGILFTFLAFALVFMTWPENRRHVAILAATAFAMPVFGLTAWSLVFHLLASPGELSRAEELVLPPLAIIAALATGLACWFAARWATRSESLWRDPETDAQAGDTG